MMQLPKFLAVRKLSENFSLAENCCPKVQLVDETSSHFGKFCGKIKILSNAIPSVENLQLIFKILSEICLVCRKIATFCQPIF